MKTIIVLTQRQYERVDYGDLFPADQYRTVLVIEEQYLSQLPESAKLYFSEIYQVSTARDANDKMLPLNADEVKAVISEELAKVSSSSEMLISCVDEYNLLLAAKMREEFNIPGPRPADVLVYRDKVLMKTRVVVAGLAVPKFKYFDIHIDSQHYQKVYDECVKELGEDFIIKPLIGLASVATGKIASFDDFVSFVEKYKDSGEEFEAEEFIKGELYHCDSLIKDGEILLTVASRYFYPNLETLSGKILGSMTLKAEDEFSQQLIQFSEAAIAALGLLSGATHTEIFVTDDGRMVFLESACRTPGILVPISYTKAFGVNYFNLALKCQVNLPVVKMPSTMPYYSLWGVVPLKFGEITELHEPNLKSQYALNWKCAVGDYIESRDEVAMFENDLGNIYAYNADYDQLLSDFNQLKDFQFVTTTQP